MTKEARKIEKHFLLVDKRRKLVKFRLNPVQKLYDQQRTNRDIILKARQQGFSTFILALFLLDCLQKKYTRSVVVSHETKATQKLLERVKFTIDHFYVGDEFVKVPTSYNNRNEIFFPETESSFYIGTAGSKTFGRGDTITNLHVSEFAFFEKPDEFLAGIMPAVPSDGRIVIETTANGFGTFRDFYEESRRGETLFTSHFFPWHANPDYALNMAVPLTDEEKGIQAAYNLSDHQMAWYHEKQKEYTNMDIFHQEFPSDDFEAFISSGRPVFNTEILKRYLLDAKAPESIGYVNVDGQFSTDKDGYVSIYQGPIDGHDYVIGADVAEGLEFSDSSSAHVVDRQTLDIVATWHGTIDPDLFARELVGLARFYRGAVIGCEVNSYGLAVNARMRELGYTGIYKRQRINKLTRSPVPELGWRTDSITKQEMITELQKVIREQTVGIPDKETVRELLSYQRDEKGHTNAQEGSHDDRVISLAIALQMRNRTTPYEFRGVENLHPMSVSRVFKRAMRQAS